MTKTIESLYIHIPFCENICDYCDFPKLQYSNVFAKPYIDRLIEEVKSYHINNGSLRTIYIGGGTPTALEDDLFEKLLSFLFHLTKGVVEYTIECNPESLSDNKLLLMSKYGVNRLSIGVESTDDSVLKSINRHHTFMDVQNAVKKAKDYGFNNINVDLILGLPHVSKALLINDINNILSLDVKHISCYSLTVHPNTMFGINGVQEPLEDDSREMYDIVHQILNENNFIHYEVSNWAKNGYESKHNLTYWKNNQYIGVGLGACGYLNNERYSNTRSINKYLDGEYKSEKETITSSEDEKYYVMLNLRTIEGINFSDYQDRYKKDFFSLYKNIINEYTGSGHLILTEKGIHPTYEGMMILDQIILDFFD